MARYVKDSDGNLICTAGGTRTWICTQAEHDRKVSAGTAPNNCVVAITDDYTEADEIAYKYWTDSTTGIHFTIQKKNGWCVLTTTGTSGSVTSSGAPVYAGTIPEGFRPAYEMKSSGVWGDSKCCAVIVSKDGSIKLGAWSTQTITNAYWQVVYPVAED